MKICTRFEADTVVPIVDVRVRDGDVVAPEDVPPVRVLRGVRGRRDGGDRDVAEDDVLPLVHLSTLRQTRDTDRSHWPKLTKLIHSGPFSILMFCTVTSVAWYRVRRIGRTVSSSFALRIYSVSVVLFSIYARKKTDKASYHAWPEPSRVPPPSRTMFVPPRSQNAAWSWKENVKALSVQ